MAGKYDINMEDMIRFQLVSEKCHSEREKRGLAFKQIALSLKVPQYRIKYIESSSVKNINAELLRTIWGLLSGCGGRLKI